MESAGVRYLRTSCICIRNRTSERSERVRFLIRQQSTFHVVLCLLCTASLLFQVLPLHTVK